MDQLYSANKSGIRHLNQHTQFSTNPLDAELLALQVKIKTLDLQTREALAEKMPQKRASKNR